MAVRPAVPWYWTGLRVFVGAALVAGIAWGLFRAFGGDERSGAAEVARLRVSVLRLESELVELRPKLSQADRQMQMDRAAAADLAKQVNALASENAALKEDLAFFQSLMSTQGAGEGALRVNRFRVRAEAVPGEYRYQMLLVQAGQRVREFQGTLQFVVDVQQEGRNLVLILPAEHEQESRDYHVSFKFFQRVEGSFKLPPGSILKGMRLRVFENGTRTPKLTQVLNVM